MSVNAKHLATFILGAAAGVALNKYLQTEEGEKTLNDLKEKASNLKTAAEGAIEKETEYFEKLKTEGAAALVEQFPGIEKFLADFMGTKPPVTSAEVVK
jgi:predicted transcriptional regulator